MATDRLPDAAEIIADVERRAEILRRVMDEDAGVSDSEWNGLVYYAGTHHVERRRFVAAMQSIQNGRAFAEAVADLPPHGRWLAAVYSGEMLRAELARGGSRYHADVLDLMPGVFSPTRILAQIRGLATALKDLQQRTRAMNPKVLENVAVDETLEQLGRALRVGRRE